jgi:glycosyltransferase involved in cell wall biosynthesis
VILTLQTSTFGTYGGIPTYNRLVCRALNEFNDASEKRVMLATDKPADVTTQVNKLPGLHLEAYDRNRVRFTRRALSLAASRRIDLLLIGHVNYAPLGWILRRMQPQLRYGVMMYGIDVWARLSPLRRRALQQADFTVSISEYTGRRAVEANDMVAKRIYLLPNALEWNEEDIRGNSVSPAMPSGTRLLTVCRLDSTEKYKGVDTVIQALPQVAARVPDVQYFIVGSGSDSARLEELAYTVGVSERVHFTGPLDDASLRAYYQSCDVFVMPSAKEGFGFVFLEAMQYCKPVVAADMGGSPEVVQDGVTGFLVKYGDIPQLAKSLTRLCLEADLRARFGRAGYKRLQEQFTFPRFRQTLTEILKLELPASAIYREHARPLVDGLKVI